MYNNWSIEKGDYVRRNLSKQDKFYNRGMKKNIKIMLFLLFSATVVSGIMLYLRIKGL